MKCTITVASLALLFLTGCAVIQQAAAPSERLELISMAPLPPISLKSFATEMKLIVLMHILQDGTVENMRMLGSSGDAEWDSLALQAMKQWRYAPPLREGLPIDVWIRQPIVVQVQEPIVMTVGDLASASLRQADSLYMLLEKGTDLDSLFRPTIGTFDIMKYTPSVRDQMKRLSRGEYTRPLRVGNKYVIYKRFRKEGL